MHLCVFQKHGIFIFRTQNTHYFFCPKIIFDDYNRKDAQVKYEKTHP